MSGAVLALIAALLPAGSCGALETPPSFGAGAAATAGSGGYRKAAAYGDGQWRGEAADPYAWAEYGSDSFLHEFLLGAGAWKDLNPDLRVKGGLGLGFGSLKGSDQSRNALIFETGVERFFHAGTLGAKYRLSRGSLAAGFSRAGEASLQQSARGKARSQPGTAAAPERFTENALAGYAKRPAWGALWGLRLTLGLTSHSRSVWDETLSCRIPLARTLYATTAATFEQGPAAAAYFSLGLYYLFR